MSIPAQAHFCWIGGALPWAYAFAVLSAAEQGGLGRVVLHHTDPQPDSPQRRALEGDRRVVLAPLDPDRLLSGTGASLGVAGDLAALYRRLDGPVPRSDLLRAALLHRDGGIYLDLDTLTVAPLTPLLADRQFVGTERVVWPAAVRRSRSPLVWARHLSLDLARKLCRALPDGWRLFRRVERCYGRVVNNAVFGAEPGTAFLRRYLHAMLGVPPGALARRTALGPDLLRTAVDRAAPGEVRIHPPHLFHPLAPEISEHWFRRRRDGEPAASLLSADTRVVHWYASIRTAARVAAITPDTVRARRRVEPYSQLVASCLPQLFAAG